MHADRALGRSEDRSDGTCAATRAVREAVRAAGCHTPVVLSGGISTFEQAEELLRDGVADIVASARQSLADPDWFRKLRLGLGDEVRRCVFTNYCEGLDQVHKPVTCKLWDHLELEGDDSPRTADGRRRMVAPAWEPAAQVKVAIVGAGPAGLYLAILLKRDDPSHQVTVFERNRLEDTFGFGVVFSDETLENVGEADPETNRRWPRPPRAGRTSRSTTAGPSCDPRGHRFSGVERKTLLELLAGRAQALGVELHWQQEIRDLSDCGLPNADLIVAADGAASLIRDRLADRVPAPPRLAPQPLRLARHHPSVPGLHLLLQGVGRRDSGAPTRTSTPRAARPSSSRRGRRPGRRAASPRTTRPATVAYLERLFEEELQGHRLLANRSIWRRFPTVRNARWQAGNVVLLGDAAHTAHFSVGSGTKLAMEDAIALAAALRTERTVPAALAAYEVGRRPQVESLQRAAQASLEWFESVERYHDTEPLQFAFNLLTRSLRITHENLQGPRSRPGRAGGSLVRGAGRPAERPPRARSIPHPRRCSRPTGCAISCCPTASWCRPCASTALRTECRMTGTWCTSPAVRSAAPDW